MLKSVVASLKTNVTVAVLAARLTSLLEIDTATVGVAVSSVSVKELVETALWLPAASVIRAVSV